MGRRWRREREEEGRATSARRKTRADWRLATLECMRRALYSGAVGKMATSAPPGSGCAPFVEWRRDDSTAHREWEGKGVLQGGDCSAATVAFLGLLLHVAWAIIIHH